MENFAAWLTLFNLSWMMAHELDAIQQREWRIFPLTALLPDRLGYVLFVSLHIPLLPLLFAWGPDPRFQAGFSVFLIVHLGLHLALCNHPRHLFKNAFSWVLIAGGAALGALHLLLGAL
ncbi:MAG: hypothetical protein HC915_17260 [Anaerolineae bacterium]|nr:hypothetical protein [Anaerolineae bacterium]